MSAEENNRQTPPKKRELTEKEFAKLFQDAYDSGLRPEHGPQRPLDLSFLEKDKKRLRRRARIMKIAAVFLLIFITSSVMTIWISGSPSEAFDHPLQKIMQCLSGGRYSTDPGSSGREEKNHTLYITDSTKIDSALQMMPPLYIPEYIPVGWQMESLEVAEKENGCIVAKYIYNNSGQGIITIDELFGSNQKVNLPNTNDVKVINGKTVYSYCNEDFNNQAVMFYDNEVFVHINAPLEEEILLKIADQMVQRDSSLEE